MPSTPTTLLTYGTYKPPSLSFEHKFSLGGHEVLAPELLSRALICVTKNYARIFLQDPGQLDRLVMRGLKLCPSHLYALGGLIDHSIAAREGTTEARERMCRYKGARLAIRVSRRFSVGQKSRRRA